MCRGGGLRRLYTYTLRRNLVLSLETPSPTTVVGATTWGTTLAILTARSGVPVTLLCRTPDETDALRKAGEHTRRLPGVPFPPAMSLQDDPNAGLADARLVIVAAPSDRFRDNLRRLARHVPNDAVILSVTKGLELPAGLRMSEVMAQELPEHPTERFATLSGPNLAGEIINGKPALTVVASPDEATGRLAQDT